MKVIELTFDPEVEMAGIDAIALVEKPAHMENWLAFSVETEKQKDMLELAKQWGLYGEDPNELLEEGFELVSIRPMKKNEFGTQSTPNDPSYKDYASTRIRYKYVGPQDSKNRDFCGEMMANNRVYRMEDINRMTAEMANPEFGQYDIFQYRGSYNCRHYWVELIYKAEGRILNDADRKRGLEGEQMLANEPTITRATANAKERKKNQRMSLVQVVNGNGLFSTKEEALQMANIIGCKGYHTHKTDRGVELYMPCETHEEYMNLDTSGLPTYTDEVSGETITEPIMFSYNDYPQEASDNACKVLKWIDEHGRDEVDGMTPVGLARANQLCKREKISVETISRMAAFERHRKNSEISPEFKGTPWKDKGYVSWLGWGGTTGIEWASRKLEQITKEEKMDLTEACWPGYVAIGVKEKGGKLVPNCVPKSKSSQQFSTNEEKMEITGAAMVPNKLIPRVDVFGDIYYVFFTAETIKKLQQKFMEDALLSSTNIEHIERLSADSLVVESWIVEDTDKDKSAALGLKYPVGTWVITMKVKDRKIWDKIKKGELKGFSIEGFFDEVRIFNTSNDDVLLETIKTIITDIKND